MEIQTAKNQIKKEEAKNNMQKMTYDQMCDIFENFIKENNCKIKKEEQGQNGQK